MPASHARRYVKLLLRAALIILLVPLLYLAAAFFGGLIPVNASWQEPEEGVAIFLRTNGVHTWVMVPTVTPQMDWRPMIEAAHIKRPDLSGDYLAFGYGNREFYLNTPTWADLSPRTAFLALFGSGPSLVHVEHERDPRPDEYQSRILISHAAYGRLVSYLRKSIKLDARGRTVPVLGRGYGATDIFYEAVGPYNAFFTCNEWTGAALRTAGVRVGLWTPFAQSITARFPPSSARAEDRAENSVSR
jgi:uncharacterized protein (TIGR02117 family)